MTNYHHTDQLGHSVTGAKTAAREALGQLAALDEELAAERETHRAEVTRLVERAEAAELERDALEKRVDELEDRAADQAEDLEEAQLERDRATARVQELEELVELLERQKRTQAQDYRLVREALTKAEDQRDRNGSRIVALQSELRAVRQRPEPAAE